MGLPFFLCLAFLVFILFHILGFVFWRFATLPGYYILTSLLCSLFFLLSLCDSPHYSLSLSLSLFLLPFIIHLLLPPILILLPSSLYALNRLSFLLSPYFSRSLPHFLLLFFCFLSILSFPFCHYDLHYFITSYSSLLSSSQDPTAMSPSSGVDHAVIGGVVAVIVFILLCLLIVLGRYLIRHKGHLLTRPHVDTWTRSCMHAWVYTELHLHKYGYTRTEAESHTYKHRDTQDCECTHA